MNMWQAVKAVIDKSRPAYKDYLGEEEIERPVMHGTIESGSSSVQMTVDDTNLAKLEVGAVYSVSVNGGESEEHTAYWLEDASAVILASTDGTQGDIDACKWIIAPQDNVYGAYRYYDTNSDMTIRVTRRVSQAKYDIKRLDKELLPTGVERDIAAAYSWANSAYSRANSAYSRADSAYSWADSAYSRADSAYSRAKDGVLLSDVRNVSTSYPITLVGAFTGSPSLRYNDNYFSGDNSRYMQLVSIRVSSIAYYNQKYSTYTNENVTCVRRVICTPDSDDSRTLRLPTIEMLVNGHGARSGAAITISNLTFTLEVKRESVNGMTYVSYGYMPKSANGGTISGDGVMNSIADTSLSDDIVITDATIEFDVTPLYERHTYVWPQSGNSISLPDQYERGTVAALPKTDDQTQSIGVDSDGFLWTAPAPEQVTPDLNAQTITSESGKKFKLVVDDNGILTTSEITE